MQVYFGIDWSQSKHDLAVVNEAGGVVTRLVLPHTAEGLEQIETLRQQLGLDPGDCWVGIETAHNILIDFLWEHGYHQVYVLPPNLVDRSRERYRQSGAHNDPSDAFVIGDLLRTDCHRFHPWHPDAELTREMRAKVGWIHYLTRTIVQNSNRLSAVLLRYYPAALHVFSDLTTQVALEFIQAYPTPQNAASLTYDSFRDFAQNHHHRNPGKLPACFARLQQTYPQANQATIQVYWAEAQCLASLLLQQVQAKAEALRDLDQLFVQHPDYPIFHSLPAAGNLIGPGLLAKFGDDRQRFPTPANIQALAGTCPVTKQSGKRRAVSFRRACDRDFRHIAQNWAKASLKESAWANSYFQQVRPHCHSDSHALRCLANRWLAIAWKLWQTRQTYDESYHLQQRALRSQARR